MVISDCKHAIHMRYKAKFRHSFLIKHIQELAKTSQNFFVYSAGWSVGNDQLIADCITGCRKAMNTGQKLAGKKNSRPKYILHKPKITSTP